MRGDGAQRAVVAFGLPSVPWLGGGLTRGQKIGLAQVGKPRASAKSLANPIIARRVALGLTRAAVAGRLGVDVDAVVRVETRPAHMRGDVRNVRLRKRMGDLYRYLEGGR